MKICFFCKIDNPQALNIIEFYKQDIDGLRRIDNELTIVTQWRKINWSADVIYIWWWTYAIFPVIVGKILRKKIIITGAFHYDTPDAPVDFKRRPMWQKLLIKSSAKLAYLNVFVSESEYAFIKKRWKLKNAAYSPHGIDIDKYKLSNKKREDFLFSMIWSDSINLRRKCLPEIIEMASLLKEKFPHYRIIVGGRKGNGYNEMDAMIREKGLEDFVSLIGEVSEKEKIMYYQTCRLYLQPSVYEGFGLATAEAMACGATVISSKAGEVENVVGDAGVLLEGHSSEELFYATVDCLNSAEKCINLGKRAQERINTRFPVVNRYNDIKRIILK